MPITQARLLELIAITGRMSERTDELVLMTGPESIVRQRFYSELRGALGDPRPEVREKHLRNLEEVFDSLLQAIRGIGLSKDEAVTIALEKDYFLRNYKKNEAAARYKKSRRHMLISQAGEPDADQILETLKAPKIPSRQGAERAYAAWPIAQNNGPIPGLKPNPNFDMTPETEALKNQQDLEDAEHAANQGGDLL